MQAMHRLAAVVLALVAVAVAAAGPAAAQATGTMATTPIFDTAGPGGPFGFNGFDVFRDQGVAERFTVPADGDFRLARIGIWFMNNSDTQMRKLRLSLQTDALDEGGAATMPSGRELEHWMSTAQTLGWQPVQQFHDSAKAPRLRAGRNYWVVAQARAPGGLDPVWLFAKKGTAVVTTSAGGLWWPAAEGGAITLRVDALPLKPH